MVCRGHSEGHMPQGFDGAMAEMSGDDAVELPLTILSQSVLDGGTSHVC